MQQSTALQAPAFIDLNVLPEDLRPRQDPAWHLLAVVAILAASFLLIPLYQAERTGEEETARLSSELAVMNEDLSRIQIDFGRARDLREQVETTEAAIVALAEERRAVLGDARQPSLDLTAITRALPPGARLASITSSDGQLSLRGRANRAADVLDLSRALSGSDRFLEARIVSLAVEGGQNEGSVQSFVIQVTQQDQGR